VADALLKLGGLSPDSKARNGGCSGRGSSGQVGALLIRLSFAFCVYLEILVLILVTPVPELLP